jgi:hypothetical protein
MEAFVPVFEVASMCYNHVADPPESNGYGFPKTDKSETPAPAAETL